MSRQRLTWEKKAKNRVADSNVPSGEPASPAYRPEKGVDAYGMDSDFGATPNPGPYPSSEHPAYPDEGPASPAYKAAALERRAAKCLRVASAMLGKNASTDDIENQALILMDLPDRAIHATLVRMGKESGKEEEEKAAETLQEEAEDKAEEKSEKKASRLDSRIARIERILVKIAGEDGKEEEEKAAESIQEKDEEKAEEKSEAKKKASRRRRRAGMGEEAMLEQMLMEEGMMDKFSEEEGMLEQMLVEEGMHSEHSEEEAMLEQMMAEEGMHHGEAMDDEAMDEEVEGEMLDEMLVEEAASADPGDHDTDESAMEEVVMTDPMGMLTGPMEEDEMMVLAKLFGGKTADDDDDDEEEEEEEEVEELEAEHAEEEGKSDKKAALRPQPKRASTGASRLGGVTKKASSGEINQLSDLWESAPDVSKYF